MDAKAKSELEQVITSTINGDNETASKVFHDYLRAKMSSMVNEQDEDMEDEVEKDDEVKDDEDADEVEDKDEDSDEDESDEDEDDK